MCYYRITLLRFTLYRGKTSMQKPQRSMSRFIICGTADYFFIITEELFRFRPYYLTLGFVAKRLSLKPLQVQINAMIERLVVIQKKLQFAAQSCVIEQRVHVNTQWPIQSVTCVSTCVSIALEQPVGDSNIQTSAEHMCMVKNSLSSNTLPLELKATVTCTFVKAHFSNREQRAWLK